MIPVLNTAMCLASCFVSVSETGVLANACGSLKLLDQGHSVRTHGCVRAHPPIHPYVCLCTLLDSTWPTLVCNVNMICEPLACDMCAAAWEHQVQVTWKLLFVSLHWDYTEHPFLFMPISFFMTWSSQSLSLFFYLFSGFQIISFSEFT